MGVNGFEASITRLVWLVQASRPVMRQQCRYVDEEVVPLIEYAEGRREILDQDPKIFLKDIPLMT